MKRLAHVASVAALLLARLGEVCAAGAYDGEWIGSATSTGGRCLPATVTLIVEGKVATGQAKFQVDAPGINGTVLEDGTLGATIGFQHLRGKFARDEFEGAFRNSDCTWKVLLKRKR